MHPSFATESPEERTFSGADGKAIGRAFHQDSAV